MTNQSHNDAVVGKEMANHDKHYRCLVHWLKARKKNSFDLADMLGEGSTVAAAIWKKYEGPWPAHP